MRNTAFLLLGLGLLVLQSQLFRVVGVVAATCRELLGPLAAWWVAGMTPSLLVPLIVYLGVHEYSLARGALLSFALGYLLDVVASAPLGLFTFISVSIFLIARGAGVRMAAQTVLTKMALAFAFALLQGFVLVVLVAIFGGDAARSRALASLLLPHAISTALLAPPVFALTQRVDLATVAAPRPAEVARR